MESDSEPSKETTSPEIKSFFDSAPPLRDGGDISEKLKEFIERNSSSSGKFTSAQLFIYAFL